MWFMSEIGSEQVSSCRYIIKYERLIIELKEGVSILYGTFAYFQVQCWIVWYWHHETETIMKPSHSSKNLETTSKI